MKIKSRCQGAHSVKKLSTTLAGNHLLSDDNFREWIQIVNKVAQQIEITERRFDGWQVEDNHNGGARPTARKPNVSKPENILSGIKDQEIRAPSHLSYQPGDIDGSGDTYMGGVNAAGVSRGERRRALWKSKAQIKKL
ncbi:hypothetical protein EPUL_006498, partial [Erysiphe pulchra]